MTMTEGSAISSASEWIVSLTSGSLAVSLAVLAIAGIGFGMLAGYIDFRRAGRAALGCFLVFGASAIATHLLDIGKNRAGRANVGADIFRPSIPPLTKTGNSDPSTNYDPYAGAALPDGR